jgi:hypothetical protein
MADERLSVIASKNPTGRRRRGVAIALLLVLLPIRPGAGLEAHSAAQPASPPAGVVPVTAGEHGEFSRVVFTLGADLEYRTEPEPQGLRVVFPGARLDFEYGGVFPARRAHRVVRAEPGFDADGASFRLRFGCDCSARTFTLDGRLMVDIFDSARGDAGPFRSSRAAEATGPDVPATPAHDAGAPADPAARLAALRDVAAETGQGQPRPEFLQRVESLSSSAQGASSDAVPDGVGFNPDHLQRMIDWAIDQGHLTGAAESDERTPTGWPRRRAGGRGWHRGAGSGGAAGACRAAGSASRCAGSGCCAGALGCTRAIACGCGGRPGARRGRPVPGRRRARHGGIER